MPSNMEAVGVNDSPQPRYSTAQISLIPPHAKDLFITATWNPREGYGDSYEKWSQEVTRLYRHLRVDPKYVHTKLRIPHSANIASSPTPYSPYDEEVFYAAAQG